MYDKDKLLAAIWESPDKITGLQWARRGSTWQSRQRPDGSDSNRPDKTILRRGSSGQIFVNYNGGSFPQGQDIWQYLQWQFNTNDFVEVLQRVGEAYGVEADTTGYTPEQIERAKKRRSEAAMLRDIAGYLQACLKSPKYGATAGAYLNSRGLSTSERLGAYNAKIRADLAAKLPDKYGITQNDAEQLLRRLFPTMAQDSAGAWKDYADSYQLAIPYTNGSGNVTGFALRLTDANAPASASKYRYSKDMAKGGYCAALDHSEAVVLVEGILDAEAMKQHGFTNVMALGGQTPTDSDEDAAKSMIKTLQRYGAKQLIYVPDYEYKTTTDADGHKVPEDYPTADATRRTIAAILPNLNGSTDGTGFVSLRIANLETAEARKNKSKVDADSFLHTYTAADMQRVLEDAVQWYEYELQDIARQHKGDADAIATEATAVYCNIANIAQRNRLKDAITAARGGYLAQLRAAGLNAAALSLIDKYGQQSTWAARMADVVAAMGKAHTPDCMAQLLTKAQRIQNADSYNAFAAQVNLTRDEMHALVCQKPDYLQTTWALYKDSYNPATLETRKYENRKISFAPAAVSVIAAPTNHGKTLILLQTAINLARQTGRKFLYLSLENDAEQLYIRALSAYMGDAWHDAKALTADGKFIPVRSPRGEIRKAIKRDDLPAVLFADSPTKTDGIDIDAGIRKYWAEIAPRLALVRTDADIDALTNNVAAQVEAWRNAGVDVGGVFVDYLQLLHYPALHAHSRTDEVKGICDRLNDLAKATKLPVILAAQFNRDATKTGGDTLDGVELANIGESAGIENIAEDVYLVWQTDKINPNGRQYTEKGTFRLQPYQERSRRCFTNPDDGNTLRRGYLYVENLKARDYATGGYCLLPYNGAAGAIISDESEY